MASPIIDIHAHAFPAIDSLAQNLLPEGRLLPALNQARRNARAWLKPFTASVHKTQTLLRHLPEPVRHGIDQMAGIAPLAGLLIESTVEDLLESMEENEIDQAILIAHPPLISNEFVLEACQSDPRLLAAVNIPKKESRPAKLLKNYAKKGARALKIHAAADGEGADSERYLALLKVASELGLPVILHTGCLHSNLVFKNPAMSRADLFKPWFERFKNLTFILAHMNFHEPQIAMDLVIEYPNVVVDTSWQPAETIGEAVRRVGADRVLFGSDWPLLGNNLSVGLSRIQDCVETGLIKREDSSKILGENAIRIFNL